MSHDWYVKIDNKTESGPILGSFVFLYFCDADSPSASRLQGDLSPAI